MKDILLVEDNKELAGLMQTFLEKDGLTVHYVSSGEAAVAYLEEQQVKMILLDLMLPGLDGFAVCSTVRKHGNVPILILSAKSEKASKLSGYELGADDYMEKPVDPEILLAKVRVLLKRAYDLKAETDILVSGAITIDRKGRKVYLENKLLELSTKEFALLNLFVENPGKTLHKDFLFNKIWGAFSASENQTLTVHIKMLRTKLEEDPSNPRRIRTVWGVGYRYEEL